MRGEQQACARNRPCAGFSESERQRIEKVVGGGLWVEGWLLRVAAWRLHPHESILAVFLCDSREVQRLYSGQGCERVMPVLFFFSDGIAVKRYTPQMLQRGYDLDVGKHLKLIRVQVNHIQVCEFAENVGDFSEKVTGEIKPGEHGNVYKQCATHLDEAGEMRQLVVAEAQRLSVPLKF